MLQASWMHSSKAVLTAEQKHPAAQATWLHSTNAAKLAAASAQPQQQAQHQQNPAMPTTATVAAAASTPPASAPAVEGQAVKGAALKGGTGSPQQRAASAGSQDDDGDDIGVDDWDDILAVWMQAAGMPHFVADSTSESSFEGQSEPSE